jgi:protein-disulfide isomerase
VEQIVHDYLFQNPQLVVELLEAAKHQMEAAKEERAHQALSARRSELLSDPMSPIGGVSDGDITIVEFFDYRCPYCKAVEPSLEALLQQDSRIRIIYKEFPILGPASVFAAHVALASRRQGKYDAFHKALMAMKGQLDERIVLDVAREVGIDLDQLRTDIKAPEIDAALRRNFDLAAALAINGTPGFVIGDNIVAGAADIDTLKRMVAETRRLE